MKIARTAEEQNWTPIQLCDHYVAKFQELNAKLLISYDRFVRTTAQQHKDLAQLIFQRALDNGDIYKDTYEGWYNVREEKFVTETEAAQSDYKDSVSGKPLTKMQEVRTRAVHIDAGMAGVIDRAGRSPISSRCPSTRRS